VTVAHSGQTGLKVFVDAYMPACIDEVAAWMCSNQLQLNTAKTEFLWWTNSRRLHQLPQLVTAPGRL